MTESSPKDQEPKPGAGAGSEQDPEGIGDAELQQARDILIAESEFWSRKLDALNELKDSLNLSPELAKKADDLLKLAEGLVNLYETELGKAREELEERLSEIRSKLAGGDNENGGAGTDEGSDGGGAGNRDEGEEPDADDLQSQGSYAGGAGPEPRVVDEVGAGATEGGAPSDTPGESATGANAPAPHEETAAEPVPPISAEEKKPKLSESQKVTATVITELLNERGFTPSDLADPVKMKKCLGLEGSYSRDDFEQQFSAAKETVLRIIPENHPQRSEYEAALARGREALEEGVVESPRVERIREEVASEGFAKRFLRTWEAELRNDWEDIRRELFAPVENVVDRFRIMWNKRVFEKYDDQSRDAYLKLTDLNDRIGEAEAKLRTYGADRAKVRTQFGGIDQRDAERAARAEERKLTKVLERMKAERRRVENVLENRNQEKARFEAERKQIAREYSNRLKDQLAPYEERIRDARAQRDQYDEEITAFVAVERRRDFELKNLERKLKDSWSKADQLVYRAAIAEIKDELKVGRKALKLRLGARAAVEGELVRLDGNTQPWRDKIDELTLLSNRQEAYHRAAPRSESPNAAHEESSRAVFGAPAPQRSEGEGATSAPPSPEGSSERQWDTKTFARRWNEFFGSELNINEAVLFGKFGADPTPKSFREQEKMVVAYLRFGEAAGRARPGITERRIRRNLKMLQSILEDEARR